MIEGLDVQIDVFQVKAVLVDPSPELGWVIEKFGYLYVGSNNVATFELVTYSNKRGWHYQTGFGKYRFIGETIEQACNWWLREVGYLEAKDSE